MEKFRELEVIASKHDVNEPYYRPKFRCLSSKFWTLWRLKWKESEDSEAIHVKRKFREANSMLNKFERRALNYPCQGTGADMTKLALIKLYQWIKNNNYLNIVKIVNSVHDEIVLECPKNISEEVGKVLIECMEGAGNYFCKTIPIKADYEIGDKWIH